MRILVVNWRDIKHPKAGGAEVHVHEMAKRWVSWGNQVTVFCSSHGKNYGTEYVDGVYYVRKGNQYSLYLHAIKFLLTNSHQFDVVLEVVNTIPFFAPLFSRARCVSLIFQWTPFTLLLDETNLIVAIATYILQAMMLLFYRSIPVITISNHAKYELIRHGLYRTQITVIHPGLNQKLFNETKVKVQKDRFSVVYMGRLKKYKGVLDIINAFREVLKLYPGAKLYIIGTGDLLPRLYRLIRVLNLEGSVVITGYLSETAKLDILSRCSIFVYPARGFDGGWSISCLEAMALGCIPLVSTNLAEMAYKSRVGFIYPAGDTRALSLLLMECMSKIRDPEPLWAKAKQWARQYTWDEAARRTFRIISGGNQKLLAKKFN